MKNGGQDGGTIVISHKEFLGDIHSAPSDGTRFYARHMRINPGDSATFPWLSQIAKNFQQYRLEGLCFHFKTMSADALNSTNTALGTIIMCTQYDATQRTPKSKAEMENMEFAQSIKPSQTVTHFVECAKNQSVLDQLYVNSNPGHITGDKRFYDFGTFTIATQGQQAADVNLGELWVSYQVRLYKPQLYDALGKDVAVFSWGDGGVLTTEYTSAQPLGESDWTNSDDDAYWPQNTMNVYAKTANSVLFEPVSVPKQYLVQIGYTGTTTAV